MIRCRPLANRDRKLTPFFLPRLDLINVMVLLLLAVLSWLPRGQGEIDLRVDAGVYYVLGTSLANGQGYRLSNEPGNIRATQYPPLVPATIAIQQKLDRTMDPALMRKHVKRLWLLFLLLFIGLAYCVLRSSCSAAWSFFGVTFCLLNTQLCFYSIQATAELPFAAFSLLFVLLFRRDSRREGLTSVAGIAAFFSRTIGMALLAAWIADAILRKQVLRAALRSSIAIACLLTWAFYIHSVENSPEYKRPSYAYQRAGYLFYNVSYAENVAYKDPFRPELGSASFKDRLKGFFTNVLAVPSSAGEAATSYPNLWEAGASSINSKLRFVLFPPSVVPAIMFAVGCCVLAGMGVLLCRREWFLASYILFTILISCCAPWQQISRYLVPIAPLLVFSLFTLVKWLGGITSIRANNRRLVVLRTSMYVAVVFAISVQASSYFLAHFRYSQLQSSLEGNGNMVRFRQFLYRTQDVELEDATTWIRGHARPNDILAAAMPQWVYLNTGRRTVMPAFESEPGKEKSDLESVPVRYLIVESSSKMGDSARDHVLPMLKRFASHWPRVYASTGGNVHVYENLSAGLDAKTQ